MLVYETGTRGFAESISVSQIPQMHGGVGIKPASLNVQGWVEKGEYRHEWLNRINKYWGWGRSIFGLQFS